MEFARGQEDEEDRPQLFFLVADCDVSGNVMCLQTRAHGGGDEAP